MALAPKDTMTMAEFLEWVNLQDQGKFELLDGHIVAMSPEFIGHTRAKMSAAAALKAAIATAGKDCEAFVDGPMIAIDETSAFQPDALVNGGPHLSGTVMFASEPVVVVEVLSPSTKHIDKTKKLQAYFKVPAVQHYLIIDLSNRAVVHHQRQSEDLILTALVRKGDITLDPPGLTVALDDLLG